MSSPAPAPSPVHWTQPGLLAMSETDGHGDTCGPIAYLDYLHLLTPAQWPLNVTAIDTLRQFAIDDGNMNQPAWGRGMTITSMAAELEHRLHITPVKVVPYNAALDFAAFRADLIAALLKHQLVIMETSNAAALPDNQPGVQYHFVLMGGLDSNLGYYTCNGDTMTALAHPGAAVEPVWYGRDALAASKPCGYLILPALAPPAPPPPPPAPAPDIKGAILDLQAVIASAQNVAVSAAAALKKLEQ